MVRTQLQIDESTYEALREAAHRQRKSMSAIVRDILQEHLQREKKPEMRTFSFVGSGSSGESDVSARHDEYLAEDFT